MNFGYMFLLLLSICLCIDIPSLVRKVEGEIGRLNFSRNMDIYGGLDIDKISDEELRQLGKRKKILKRIDSINDLKSVEEVEEVIKALGSRPIKYNPYNWWRQTGRIWDKDIESLQAKKRELEEARDLIDRIAAVAIPNTDRSVPRENILASEVAYLIFEKEKRFLSAAAA